MFLETNELSKEFHRNSSRGQRVFTAVSDVSLAIEQGAFATVTGKSGSGKTTLLTLLSGLAAPTSGTVRFKGQDMHALPDKELSALRNRDIGFVPQGSGLLGNLTVYDNVRAPQIFAGRGGSGSERAEFLLEVMGVYDLADEYPSSLSGGEMRRVSIARALFNDPVLLIADEPMGDLDPENTLAVMELLKGINRQGTTVIVVTHEAEVASFGSRRFSMTNGMLSEIMQ